jgi:hypothetical protein
MNQAKKQAKNPTISNKISVISWKKTIAKLSRSKNWSNT